MRVDEIFHSIRIIRRVAAIVLWGFLVTNGHANAADPQINPAEVPVSGGANGEPREVEENTWIFGENGALHVSGGEAGDGTDGEYKQEGEKVSIKVGDDRFIARYDGEKLTFQIGERSNSEGDTDIHSLASKTLTTEDWESQDWWTPRHDSILKRVSEGNVDLVFLGDSITHHWTEGFFVGTGQEIWKQYYGHRNAVNMGFAGDDTRNVLWRLINGEVDGISPKLVVVMIGTNNTGDPQTIENIGDGVIAIVNTLRQKLPQTKVLLLGIFPRAENPGPLRDKIAKINQHASKVADGEMVHYLDIGAKFLNPDGTMSPDIMPDYVHPSEKGYQIWAEAIEPKVSELMGE